MSRTKKVQAELLKILDQNSYGRNPREVFESFLLLASCACAYGTREDDYSREIARWDAPQQRRFADAFALLVEAFDESPFIDVLGPIYMDIGARSSQKWGGEFYTSPDICRMMAQVSIDASIEIPFDRPLTFLEPACGSGAMVLACAERLVDLGHLPQNMLATCIDISPIAVDMCFINLTLNGIPATVVHGNTLTLQTWGAWRTICYPFARGTAEPNHIRLLNFIRSGEPEFQTGITPQLVTETEATTILEAAAIAQPGLFDVLEVTA